MYKLDVEVDVVPVNGYAEISYGIQQRKCLLVTEPVTLTSNCTLDRGCYKYQLELHNDAVFDIVAVRVNNMQDYQFIYVSEYEPQYPEPWRSSQGHNWPTVLQHHTNICWPGVWTLNLESPVYPWIHSTLDLGWIY